MKTLNFGKVLILKRMLQTHTWWNEHLEVFVEKCNHSIY